MTTEVDIAQALAEAIVANERAVAVHENAEAATNEAARRRVECEAVIVAFGKLVGLDNREAISVAYKGNAMGLKDRVKELRGS